MRKVVAAVLAVPVLSLVYGSVALRRSGRLRVTAAVVLALSVGISAVGLSASRLPTATATKPTPIVPVARGALGTEVRTGVGLVSGIDIPFTARMDPDSVRASLDIEPASAIAVSWSPDGTVLTVRPLGRWAASSYYTITVQPGALAATGRPLAAPVRAAFLTRAGASATITPTAASGGRVPVDAAFSVAFDRPLDPATIAGAFLITPVVAGAWEAVPDEDLPGGVRYRFTPLRPLAADTTYTAELAPGVRAVDGGTVESTPLVVRTASTPSVVRFRPLHGTPAVARDSALSVRFTEPMDRAATAGAFSATAGTTTLAGKTSWAENDTVLVFKPSDLLPWGQPVVLRVTTAARSAAGVPLARHATSGFTIEAKPAPIAPRVAPPSSVGSGGSGGSGGGSVGSGSWTAVEAYYLKLMNCTRTGGLVTSSGGCSSPGGRNVAPLALDAGISSKVARPYARLLATNNACSHFIGGNPGDRLRRAGYTSYTWAENLGCRSGDPYGAVLGSHLYFQGERSWSPQGGHYVNMMNAKYDRAGIGVWVSGGRVRLVVDFYHP